MYEPADSNTRPDAEDDATCHDESGARRPGEQATSPGRTGTPDADDPSSDTSPHTADVATRAEATSRDLEAVSVAAESLPYLSHRLSGSDLSSDEAFLMLRLGRLAQQAALAYLTAASGSHDAHHAYALRLLGERRLRTALLQLDHGHAQHGDLMPPHPCNGRPEPHENPPSESM
ncbi:hypothetical protein [Streptomyces sp. TR02-1]|uniref:hypothetical protein n=1 Tax=Streptomyces sp. TR02-1 TaxID=3385977 RepID=UPI0039A1CDE0